MAHKRLLLAALVLLLVDCGGDATGPTPLPSGPPTATPTPPLFPALSRADLTSDLPAAVNCCADDNPADGDEGVIHDWPGFDDEVLGLYTRGGVRLTEVRIGPGGDESPESALLRLEDAASRARPHGITILAGLFDAWVAVHGLNAYGDGCEVTQGPPPERYRQWTLRVAEVARRNPNVVLFDGNEQFRCRPAREWVSGLEAFAREAGYAGLFGSNAETGQGDFQVHHGWRPVEAGSILLESDNRDHTVEEWRALRASSAGAIAFWRGPMSMPEWERLLTEPSSACAPPPVCPPAGRMGVQLHTSVGSVMTFNLTPQFGSGPNGGRPCNAEHREACSSLCGAFRECEPPQEPSVTVEGNVASYRLQNANRYKLNVVGAVGPITVTTCWNPASTDAEGLALDLSHATCDSVEVP